MSTITTLVGVERHQLLYVGVDVHKDVHTAVAANHFGENLLELETSNYQKDFVKLVNRISQLAEDKGLTPVFGLEDSHGWGARIAKFLFGEGFSIKMVSPVLVDRGRRYETHPEKTDSLDALGAAKVLIQRIDSLPDYSVSPVDQLAKEIKELSIDREFLVKEQSRLKNQLHRLLHRAYNSKYQDKFRDPFTLKGLRYWKRCPVPRGKRADVLGDPEILANQIRRKIRRLLDIREELKETDQELDELITRTKQPIKTLNGCGTVLASQVLAQIRNINRFRSPDALAKYAGLCPRELSSGKKKRHIKTKSGNRKLNMAIHRIALSQIGRSGNKLTREYFDRKVSQGKSKVQALACLKRKLVNVIFVMLKNKEPYRALSAA